jgi:hypothetical protein
MALHLYLCLNILIFSDYFNILILKLKKKKKKNIKGSVVGRSWIDQTQGIQNLKWQREILLQTNT